MKKNSFNLITNLESLVDIPDPLPEHRIVLEYPTDALGEILGEAAKRLAYHVQVPEGMAAQSVLAVASLVAQAYVNVSIPSVIGTKPISLYFLTVAESGDRKSSVDALALSALNDYETDRLSNFKSEIESYDAAVNAWKIRRESIVKTVQSNMTAPEQKELEEELFDLEKSKPILPARPNIMFSEPTPEGIFRHYQQALPNAGLFSDEGISFFNGHGMKDDAKGRMIGMLSHLWDGKTLSRTRGALEESGILTDCRLSAHLMLQPIVAEKIFTDPIMQGQGIMARFLIFDTPSMAGRRFLKDRDLTNGARNDPAVIRYWETVKTLLARKININEQTGGLVLASMEIYGDALKVWSDIHDSIEAKIAHGQIFEHIKPFASKGAEQVARISVVLAVFEEEQSPNVNHIQRASVIVDYYLKSMANRMKETQYDKDELFARDLLGWIKSNGGVLRCNDFKSIKPPSIRPAKIARKILNILVEQGYLFIREYSSRSGKASVWEVIHPQ